GPPNWRLFIHSSTPHPVPPHVGGGEGARTVFHRPPTLSLPTQGEGRAHGRSFIDPPPCPSPRRGRGGRTDGLRSPILCRLQLSVSARRRTSSTPPSSVRWSSGLRPVNVRPKSVPFLPARTHFTWPGRLVGAAERPSRTSATTRAWAAGGSSSVERRAPRALSSVK